VTPNINLDTTQNNPRSQVRPVSRFVLLNAMPVSAFKKIKPFLKIIYLGKLSDVQITIPDNAISYISHLSTAAMLGVQVNKAIYESDYDDRGYVFVLASPQRNPTDQQITKEQIDVYYFEVEPQR